MYLWKADIHSTAKYQVVVLRRDEKSASTGEASFSHRTERSVCTPLVKNPAVSMEREVALTSNASHEFTPSEPNAPTFAHGRVGLSKAF
ncbi:hypothetical protein SCLCIDRAFT_318753 [Scleroderma citrinum Foug A]|uniref:Uncharacterized protein n=1 Tax=Scleroderma citrinum Foug A TaxID=1036808 RepID=A0A0C2YZR1_9AGAM|nr:hypothetical protein SCLCIDRAFT_318753 [Scleroderma citrinum Foug A]